MFSNVFSKSQDNSGTVYTFPSELQSFISSSNNMDEPLLPTHVSSDPESDADAQASFSRRFLAFIPGTTNAEEEPTYFRSLSRRQRLVYFILSLLCASLFFSLALIFLPLLATPSGVRKFVFMYVLGNIALIVSFSFAYGPWSYAKSSVTREKLPSTIVYFTSIFLGVWGVVIWRSTICAIIAVVLQVGLAAWQLKIFIIGGTKLFSFLFKGWSMRWPGSSSESSLPI